MGTPPGTPPQEPYPGFTDNVHAQYDQQVQRREQQAAAQAGRPVQRVTPMDLVRGDLPGHTAHAQGKLRQKFVLLGVFFGILLLIGVAALIGMLI
ncbi:hypothetical protein SMC26_25040 [Actinomadura fulvescens]|uniref:Serine protease n=1 Tax=Actinomadura fulvescens TaxID=46160 RepID=A0ABP6CGZ0_9ACTN